MEAIVLAGGLGTRLRAAVADVPKPMAPVRGRPFLEYLMSYWIAQGVDRFVLSVGYKHESIQTHFGNRFGAARIDYALEEQPLGTGGGLCLAAKKVLATDTVLVLNGDTYFQAPLAAMCKFHAAQGADVTFSLFRSGDDQRYTPVRMDERSRIVALEGDIRRGQNHVNGGAYIFNVATLRLLESLGAGKLSLETDLFPRLLTDQAAIYGYPCDGMFIDIGVPEDYRRAQSLLPAVGEE